MEKHDTLAVIRYLTKYNEILKIIDAGCSKEIKEIETLVSLLHECIYETSLVIPSWKTERKKVNFDEVIRLYKCGRINEIKGLKLNYKDFSASKDVIHYFEGHKKEEILKATTLMDLKILFFMLTGDERECKRKKDQIIELILSYVKAQKQGEAFGKWV